MKSTLAIFVVLTSFLTHAETRTCTFVHEAFGNASISIQWESPVQADTVFQFSVPITKAIKTFGIVQEDSSGLNEVKACIDRLPKEAKMEVQFECVIKIYGENDETKSLIGIPYDYFLTSATNKDFSLSLEKIAFIKRYALSEMSQFGQAGISEYFDVSGKSLGLILNLISTSMPLKC